MRRLLKGSARRLPTGPLLLAVSGSALGLAAAVGILSRQVDMAPKPLGLFFLACFLGFMALAALGQILGKRMQVAPLVLDHLRFSAWSALAVSVGFVILAGISAGFVCKIGPGCPMWREAKYGLISVVGDRTWHALWLLIAARSLFALERLRRGLPPEGLLGVRVSVSLGSPTAEGRSEQRGVDVSKGALAPGRRLVRPAK